MKKITKDKLLVVLYSLIVGSTFYMLLDRYQELWQKAALVMLAVITIVLHIRNANRTLYYKLIDDVLVTRQIFSKQKKYCLNAVSSWTETQYHFLEVNTALIIVLNMKEGTKLSLSKRNSKDFEKLSNYLNENIPDAFESKK
ncbi:hypothetical protein CLU81_5380 [Flavobacterium sp. 9]|uniref:hypothetical protein n=1 Tax=Flavobacterium sp. 9 TaxID=2035198 RepID=UPI000C17886B|nr:hypothetical protein [Flavobacterium sp. 9]PIF34719.1 hypothetical protein CLU81_5380 [Flavobacterium sp. 9]